MRFDQQQESNRRRHPPNYLGQSTQKRLLLLTAMLCLVVLLMHQARQARNWRWLWTLPGSPVPSSAAASEDAAWIPASNVTEAQDFRDVWHPELDRELLRAVRDDTFFHDEEAAAWFHLLDLLRRSDSAELDRFCTGSVSYLQVYRQTAAYRGRLVQIDGTIRRLQSLKAPVNSDGIDRYWQAWLFTDAKPTDPIVLYLLDVPTSMLPITHTPGTVIEQNVPASVTGFVYKRWTYRAAGGLNTAPVLVAASVRPKESIGESPRFTPGTGKISPRMLGFALGGTATLALAAAWLAYRFGTPTGRRPANSAEPVVIQIPRPSSDNADES